MTMPSAAVLVTLSTLPGLPQPPRPNQCPATTPVTWDEDNNHHRCTHDTGHHAHHRCQHCTHTWETSGGER